MFSHYKYVPYKTKYVLNVNLLSILESFFAYLYARIHAIEIIWTKKGKIYSWCLFRNKNIEFFYKKVC